MRSSAREDIAISINVAYEEVTPKANLKDEERDYENIDVIANSTQQRLGHSKETITANTNKALASEYTPQPQRSQYTMH